MEDIEIVYPTAGKLREKALEIFEPFDLLPQKLYKIIDNKYVKIMHVVYETLPHTNRKFYLYFVHFCVYWCNSVSEFFDLHRIFFGNLKVH